MCLSRIAHLFFPLLLLGALFFSQFAVAAPERNISIARATRSNSPVILRNAAIYTGNPSAPWAQALAYSERGVILHVGSNEAVTEALQQDGITDAHRINMNGAFVMPSFQDIHTHIPEAGINAISGLYCTLQPGKSVKQYLSDLRKCAQKQKSSVGWLRAAGASLYDFQGASPLKILDEAFPNRPVIVLDDLGHGAWINSKAMELADIQEDDDPQGGIYGWDRDGNFNGLLFENAQQTARDAAQLNYRDMYEGLLEALYIVAKNGITTVSDAGGFWTRGTVNLWLNALDNDDVTVRAKNCLYIYPDMKVNEQLKTVKKLYRNGKGEEDLVSFNTAKIYVDGILALGTALLLDDYDYPLNEDYPRGFPYFKTRALKKYARELIKSGFAINFHSIGDGAVRKALDVLESVPKSEKSRSRITHGYMIDEADEARFRKLNVIPDFQMAPDAISESYQEELSELIGDRAYTLIPTKRLLAAGATVTISSDWDADPISPITSMMRALQSKRVPDLETAIKLWTMNPAYALRHDDVTGSLEKGKYADYVVLSKNLFEIKTRAFDKVKVRKTVLGGRVVYEEFVHTHSEDICPECQSEHINCNLRLYAVNYFY